jgi:tetratricopeptide (TPR) repeat protein
MGRRARTTLIALALAGLAVAAYAPVLDNDFVNYDDDLYILNAAVLRSGLGAEGVTWAFRSVEGANWFPMTRLSWLLDAELFGIEARAFHATNLLLHALTAALLFVALARLTGARVPSAVVAALFAVHPLHVESVAWAAARKDVLSGLFAVGTLLAYERAVRGPSRAAWVGVGVCLALGLMAKPTLVVLPLALLLLDLWPLGRLRRGGTWDLAALRRAVIEKLPLLALAFAAGLVTLWAQSSGGALRSLGRVPLGARLSNAPVAAVGYLADAVWPAGLAVFYPHPGSSLPAWQVVGAGLLLLALTAGALRALPRRPYLTVGWLWYLLWLAPVIGLVQVGQAARADRYTYLSLLGVWIALVWGLAGAVRGRARIALAAAAAASVAALAVATSFQVRTWRDSETLFRHALAVTRDNHVAHINLGVVLYNTDRLDEASQHLVAARRIAPASATAAGVLGDVRTRQERFPEAEALYRRALELEPGSLRWQLGLANALRARGETRRAVELFREILARDPDSIRARLGLAVALSDAERIDEAGDALEAVLALRPGMADVHAVLGSVRARQERYEEAIEHYRRAVDGGVEDVMVLNNLAWLLLERGGDGEEVAREALALARSAAEASARRDARVLDTLAVAAAAAGRGDEARRAAAEAVAAARAAGDTGLAERLEAKHARMGR